jgi:hypothetical protein
MHWLPQPLKPGFAMSEKDAKKRKFSQKVSPEDQMISPKGNQL